MKKRVLAVAWLVALLLVSCVTTGGQVPTRPVDTPSPSPSLSLFLFPTSTYSIRHTALDPQSRHLSVFFEVPVFQEEGEGYRKINAFFEQMEKDYFSLENEELVSLWKEREEAGYTQRSEHSAKVLLQTETLVCVQMSVYHVTGRAFDWTDSYTFDVRTGERLLLSDMVEEPEDEVLSMIWTELENSKESDVLFWSKVKEKAVDDFDFFLDNDQIYIAFDVDEIAATCAGSFYMRLPATLKQEWRSN